MDITKYFSKAGGNTPSSSAKKAAAPAVSTAKRSPIKSKVDETENNSNANSSQEQARTSKGRKKRAIIDSDDEDDVVIVDTPKPASSTDKPTQVPHLILGIVELKLTEDCPSSKKAKIESTKEIEVVDPSDYFASSKKTTKAVAKEEPKAKGTSVKEEPKAAVSKSGTAGSKRAPKKSKAKDDDDDFFDDDFEPIDDDVFDDDVFDEEEEKSKVTERKEPKPSPKKPAVKPAEAKKDKGKEVKKEKEPKAEDDEEEGKGKKSSFWQLKNRLPPQELGSREIPQAAPNCLSGMTFVLSGEFETVTRTQTEDLIKRYGGRLTAGVSGKTTHFLKGRDAGPSKTEKAEKLGTNILDEDGFFQLLKSSKAKEIEIPPMPALSASTGKGKGKELDTVKSSVDASSQLWTDKYKPQKLEDILGNKELVKRISAWLKDWESNRGSFKYRNKENINDFGAVLMSGPPGIGKTTAAHVVAKVNGYELLEFNASDVRSKKVLEESVSEMMDNRTMTEFFTAGKPKQGDRLINGKKVVLVMDEVDGMSAGDRGGAAEMAKLIKNTKIPVICICNDIRAKKIEPLLRVCYEAKFKRTPAAQLRSRFMTIAFREGLKIEPNAIDQLVDSTRNDIRQIINILSTYRLAQDQMTFDQAKVVGKTNEKYSQINLFEIPGMLLSSARSREMSLSQKSEIYFHDYSLSHLMFFENYARWNSDRAMSGKNQAEQEALQMDAIADAADAMSDGAIVDGMIHGSTQHWSLMPVHSMFSMVRPAHFMKGQFSGARINFPSWLGQNSKAMKRKRLLRDIQIHMRTKSSGDKYEVRQNYLPLLNLQIFSALLKEDYDTAIEVMDSYFLDKDLVDAIAELEYPLRGQKSLSSKMSSAIKTKFTKIYNAGSHPVMLQPGGQTIKKAIAVPMDDPEGTIFEDEADFGADVSEEEGEKVEDDTNLAKDKYIKTKDLSAKGKAATPVKTGTKRKANASTSAAAKKKK